MENFFTKGDLEEFLSQHDYGLWTMQVIDKSTSKLRPVNPEDLKTNSEITLEMIENDEKTLKVFSFNNFKFCEVSFSGNKKITKNMVSLSIDWCNSLLDSYGQDYAKALKEYCEKSINHIMTTISNSKDTLPPEKRNFYTNVRVFFSKLLSLANNKINESKNIVST